MSTRMFRVIARSGEKFQRLVPRQSNHARSYGCGFPMVRTNATTLFARRDPFLKQCRSLAVTTETLETLGDSITSAVLVSWSKEPGDSVAEDDVIAIVETDKVTMDIKAKKSGVFVKG